MLFFVVILQLAKRKENSTKKKNEVEKENSTAKMNLKQENKGENEESKGKKAGINVVNKLCCFPVNFSSPWEHFVCVRKCSLKTLKQLGSAKCIEKKIVNGLNV